jgi:hypothetical protein
VKFSSLFAVLGKVIERDARKREQDARKGVRCGCGALNHYPLAVGSSCRWCGAELSSITIEGGHAA